MNIYSEDIVKKYKVKEIQYLVNKGNHSETINIVFTDLDNGKERFQSILKDAPILSSWLQLLNFGGSDEESTESIINELSPIVELFPVDGFEDISFRADYLMNMTDEELAVTTRKAMEILSEVISKRPSLIAFYKDIHEVLQMLWEHLGDKKNIVYTTGLIGGGIGRFRKSINIMPDVIKEARKYCTDVFMIDNAPGSTSRPEVISEMYRLFCNDQGIIYYPDAPMLPRRLKFKDGVPVDRPTSWPDYYAGNKNEMAIYSEDFSTTYLTDTESLIYAGIKYMLSTDSVLRKCKLCGGYFRTRYTTSKEYCARLYKDTKAVCYEYASRQTYKEKLFKHPIHQEFTRAYNKLYGRIRRGKLPADTPLMDQLKALHDEYYERYENTHKKAREEVWKEYIEKNEELLKNA